jgi:hypothetical protein
MLLHRARNSQLSQPMVSNKERRMIHRNASLNRTRRFYLINNQSRSARKPCHFDQPGSHAISRLLEEVTQPWTELWYRHKRKHDELYARTAQNSLFHQADVLWLFAPW